LTSETNADAKVTSHAYDPMSNFTGMTDALNRTEFAPVRAGFFRPIFVP